VILRGDGGKKGGVVSGGSASDSLILLRLALSALPGYVERDCGRTDFGECYNNTFRGLA
jgi:hypothetical protein